MNNQETRSERETRLKRQYQELHDKKGFAIKLSKELERRKYVGAPRTILTHWFSDAVLSGSMPSDNARLRVIEKHLNRAIKNQTEKAVA